MPSHIDLLLRELERQNGSDLHLKVGRPALMRIHGDLAATQTPPLTQEDLTNILYPIMTEKQIHTFEETAEADFSYEIPGLARFRVNVFRQRGCIGAVLRQIPTGALANALRAVLRQDPDIILMGEMRDPETIRFGITAAETGHLVFATLHTNNATQTLDRILDTMPPDTRDMVRSQLALILVGIICQRLCKRADNTGRVAAQEILVNSANISQLILENKTRSIEKAILDGKYYGMQTFNQALHALSMKGLITQEEAMGNSDTPDDLKLMFRGITTGTNTTESMQQAMGSKTEDKKKKTDRGFDF